jgi:hypothetical protein
MRGMRGMRGTVRRTERKIRRRRGRMGQRTGIIVGAAVGNAGCGPHGCEPRPRVRPAPHLRTAALCTVKPCAPRQSPAHPPRGLRRPPLDNFPRAGKLTRADHPSRPAKNLPKIKLISHRETAIFTRAPPRWTKPRAAAYGSFAGLLRSRGGRPSDRLPIL